MAMGGLGGYILIRYMYWVRVRVGWGESWGGSWGGWGRLGGCWGGVGGVGRGVEGASAPRRHGGMGRSLFKSGLSTNSVHRTRTNVQREQ